ncbi:Exporter protein, RND family [hydrothermal vent metagenome]|uniref:Exporter protein, RND family n=1 Tax=hydrothermal vent metagenome TaxID=652676 RepID=A0A3B1CQN9_9ZZZZ
MKDFRKRIENSFESFTRLIYRHSYLTLFIMLVLIGSIVSNLPKITIDTSTEGFLHESDPAITAYNQFRDQFGRDEVIIIAIKPDDVFNLAFLKKLRDFHHELEDTVPYLDDITSLVNARNTRGEADELIVEDLLENFPQNEQDLAVLKKRVLGNPIYKNMLISEDGKFTTVIIKTNAYSSIGVETDALSGFEDEAVSDKPEAPRKFITDAENSEVVRAVRKVVAKYEGYDFPVKVAGSPVFTNDLKSAMMKDMRKFMLMATLMIAFALYFMFRRISGVFMPLLVVILSLLSTVGFMALLGVPIKLPTQILPSFILAVGVCDAVHVLAIFYNRLQKGDNKEDAIVYTMGHSGLAITMTSLTTAVGLGSFSTAAVAPIADLGQFASLGVMLALLYTIVLLPALIAIVPIKAKEGEEDKAKHAKMDKLLILVADFATGHPKKILVASALLVVVSISFLLNVRFSHNPMVWLPDSMPVKSATQLIDKELKGTVSLEMILDTGHENGLYNPVLLKHMDGLATEVEGIKHDGLFVGKAWSLADILKEINKALNENREEFYAVPDDRRLIAQEFLLFENSGSDDLEDFVDSQFSKARFTIKAPWIDANRYPEFIDDITSRFTRTIGDDATFTVTGMIPILGRTISAAMYSAAVSYVIAGVVITLMMIALLGDVKLGLVSMLPNLTPILLILGIMGMAGIPLDMFNMLIGSIAIGLAVDDTVHFMHNFRRYYAETGDAREATRHTLLTAGRAMFTTSVVLSLGFFIFMMASLNNLFYFGMLIGIAIIAAVLADFLMAPALMALMMKNGRGFSKKLKTEV